MGQMRKVAKSIWHNHIQPFTFTHTTSDSIAENILRTGLDPDPNKRDSIFDKARRLNEILIKYTTLGNCFINPEDLNRNYVFISPLEVYVDYQVPESIKHLMTAYNPICKKIEDVLESGGSYAKYLRATKDKGIVYFATKYNYDELIGRGSLVRDYKEIKMLGNDLKRFHDGSKSTTLHIYNKGVLDCLKEPVREIFRSFNRFYKFYLDDCELKLSDIERDVRLFIVRACGSNEIKIKRKIEPEHIKLKITKL
jgi:hypothetical protein